MGVNTRSGAGTTTEVPEQEDVSQPVTTPVPRTVALGQSPEVYYAGSLASRPTYRRSPLVWFEPSQHDECVFYHGTSIFIVYIDETICEVIAGYPWSLIRSSGS
jgi:hypothetical protein